MKPIYLRGFAPISLFAENFMTRCDELDPQRPRDQTRQRAIFTAKSSMIRTIPLFVVGVAFLTAPGCSTRRTNRFNHAVCSCLERLRTIVGHVATNPRSRKRETRACECGAKYNPDHRSQHIPISKGERRWYASSRDFYGESHYEPQTS